MFEITKELSEKLRMFVAQKQPVLASGNISMAIYCPTTCQTNCVGSCKGSCSKNCASKVK